MKFTKILSMVLSTAVLLCIIPSTMASHVSYDENREKRREITKEALLSVIPESLQAGMYNHLDGSLTVYVKETKNRSTISVKAEVPYTIEYVRYSYDDLLAAHGEICQQASRFDIMTVGIDIVRNKVLLELYSDSSELRAFLVEKNLMDCVVIEFLNSDQELRLTFAQSSSKSISK